MLASCNIVGGTMEIKKTIWTDTVKHVTMLLLMVYVFVSGKATGYASVQNDNERIVIEYRYFDGEVVPEIPESTSRGGQEYVLEFTNTAPDETYEHTRQYFTHQNFAEVPVSQIESLGEVFDSYYYIEDGTFEGEIELTNYDIVPFYVTINSQVDRQLVFPGLPDNDVNRIPWTQTFQVRSASSASGYAAQSYERLELNFEYVPGSSSRPGTYTAYATYRGTESYLQISHYEVTAIYEGEVESTVGQNVITATYAPAAYTVIDDEDTATTGTDPNKASLDPVVLAIISATLVLSGLFIYVFAFQKNIILYRNETKVHSARLRVIDDEARYSIPDKIDVMDGSEYKVILKPRLAIQRGRLVIIWQGGVISDTSLATTIIIPDAYENMPEVIKSYLSKPQG